MMFSVVHILAMLFFFILIIYTLITNFNLNTSKVCGNDLWILLLMHFIMPFILGLILYIISTFISPFLLIWTHTNPFWILLPPLLIIFVYNNTLLALGIRSLLQVQNNDICLHALKNATQDFSPDQPLLIILSWVFVGIDSLAVLCEILMLFSMFFIQSLTVNP